MHSKVIFFDIDGTIWDENHKIPKSTVETIRLLKENGHKTFICSGRARGNIIDERLLNIGFDGIIAACGNHIEMDGEVLYENILSDELVEKSLNVTTQQHIPVVLEGPEYHWFDIEKFSGDPYTNKLKKVLKDKAVPLENYEGKIVINKFSGDITEDTDMNVVEKELGEYFDFLIHEGDVIEFVPKNTSKATGIKKVCEILNIKHQDTFAIGDSINDVEMLEYVNTGIAMGNCTQPARKVADYVTTSLWEDGIYNAMKHFELI
ncbi:Cof-type HAD-IIB family hydrolase [Lachnobacterium bovis]|uniref:Cof subfamily of IIB subfamily of haloacid dehalogenase superfamily/HAD-superfamily hydrolase, subfamily IIB n=1 Tax=Lachnobacterium bovis TaxID=140626 RepID=A0A1H9QHZ0_9FIRM|nr:Cof-type HAD-IIB family hydrolase [Lachnobacterium bovis]SER60037.1 hypothetical protein SAMN02910429_00552 [Lachnobacterium bovis]